ncbi:Mss4-like protein [Colletotrichum cereale]|nr:Mss4-like protein [Colletotrichum cereale]
MSLSPRHWTLRLPSLRSSVLRQQRQKQQQNLRASHHVPLPIAFSKQKTTSSAAAAPFPSRSIPASIYTIPQSPSSCHHHHHHHIHTSAANMTKEAETNSIQTTGNSKDEHWKTEAPYVPPGKSHPHGDSFQKKIRGACQCGQVSYWLQKDKPLSSKYCHCKDCQKMHGAPFQWAAIFHKEDLAFDKGVDGLVFYSSGKNIQGHDLPCKVSCGFCGSRIMDEGRNMVLLFPGLLHFDGEKKRENFEVQYVLSHPLIQVLGHVVRRVEIKRRR